MTDWQHGLYKVHGEIIRRLDNFMTPKLLSTTLQYIYRAEGRLNARMSRRSGARGNLNASFRSLRAYTRIALLSGRVHPSPSRINTIPGIGEAAGKLINPRAWLDEQRLIANGVTRCLPFDGFRGRAIGTRNIETGHFHRRKGGRLVKSPR